MVSPVKVKSVNSTLNRNRGDHPSHTVSDTAFQTVVAAGIYTTSVDATRDGWLYLAVVVDLFARRVVGWAVSDRLHRELALKALRKAIVMRRPPPGLIHHSDRGAQYCSMDYQAELRHARITISMSGKGNCYDNAMVETFFKTLKSELVWRTIFLTRQHATAAIARYIDGFYNPIRRHSALGYRSLALFERDAN